MTGIHPLAQLAELMVHTDFVRSEADAQALRAAREAERRAIAEELNAMHEAADAIATQAWIQGGMAAAGGTLQCVGSAGQLGKSADLPEGASPEATKVALARMDDGCRPWQTVASGGQALHGVAAPAGELVGGTARAEAEADAREAGGEAEQAGSRADEALQHRQRVERHTDSVLELIEGTLESERQANLAILGNF
jgi:hypothetical protein